MESLHHLYKIGHGPSSSHTMGPEAACNYIINNYKNVKSIKVTLFGSLALTGKGHLTDMIIYQTLKDYETKIVFNFDQIPEHPNTMVFDLFDLENKKIDTLTFFSIGGGDIVLSGSTNKKVLPRKQHVAI